MIPVNRNISLYELDFQFTVPGSRLSNDMVLASFENYDKTYLNKSRQMQWMDV